MKSALDLAALSQFFEKSILRVKYMKNNYLLLRKYMLGIEALVYGVCVVVSNLSIPYVLPPFLIPSKIE